MAYLTMIREPFSALSHGFGAVLAILGTTFLLTHSGRKPGSGLSCLVYGFCLTFCLASSAAWHTAIIPQSGVDRLLVLDHIGIFLLIAGTYTPIARNVLEGKWQLWTLVGVWTFAALGVASHVISDHPPLMLGTILYLAMGWGSLLCYPEIARRSPRGSHWWILIGGILYSLGATFNVLRWPNPWPTVVGYHGQFHVFVLAAAATHFVYIAKTARPFRPMEPSNIFRPSKFRSTTVVRPVSSSVPGEGQLS